MMVLRAFSTGLRSALASPRLLLLLWCVLLMAAVPFGLVMQQEIADDIGASRVHLDLRQRLDAVWLGEFSSRAESLGQTLEPATAGRVDFLRNLDLLFGGRLFSQHRGLVAAGVGYALVSLLMLGGVIDRFARGGGRFVLSQFLGACGRYFGRLLKLTALSTVLYWGVYRGAKWVYVTLERGVQDVTVEATVLRYYLLAAVPILLLAALVMMVFDYARIAAILEEQPGTLRALSRGLRFVFDHPVAVLALAVLVGLCVIGLVALRTVLAPGVGEATVLGIGLVFLLGQLFVAARLALRLTLVAAELALYRGLR